MQIIILIYRIMQLQRLFKRKCKNILSANGDRLAENGRQKLLQRQKLDSQKFCQYDNNFKDQWFIIGEY